MRLSKIIQMSILALGLLVSQFAQASKPCENVREANYRKESWHARYYFPGSDEVRNNKFKKVINAQRNALRHSEDILNLLTNLPLALESSQATDLLADIQKFMAASEETEDDSADAEQIYDQGKNLVFRFSTTMSGSIDYNMTVINREGLCR